jgi:flagellar biosynthesis protein FlhF
MKFEGATMRDAIAKVKAELGDHAVIIASRQVRRGLLGSAVEISAAIDTDEDHAPPAFSAGPSTSPTFAGNGPSFTGPTMGGPMGGGQAAAGTQPTMRTEQEVEKLIAPLRSELRSLRALVRTAGDSRGATELKTELASLRRLVETMRPMAGGGADEAISQPARQASNVAPTAKPTARGTLAPTREAKRAGSAETREVARRTPHELPITASSTGHIVMLVGPTGAGKTTTIAKLATRAALIEGRRTALITLDNYRVGGVDQIRTFANLIGVPLTVAESASELASLIDPSHDLTLIDTAGKSPRDRASIEELARHMEGLDIEVHLVVPAGATGAQIDELVQRYSSLAPSRLLFTKVDEVDGAPELALAPARTRLPITWVTTGQAVPEDIEQPSTARVLELASRGLGDTPTPTFPPPSPSPSSTRHRSPRAA